MSWATVLGAVEAELQLLVLQGEKAAVGGRAELWRDSGLTVRTVRGGKMRTPPRLFDEFAAAFQFPSYFGQNWDAFDDCLADLDWLPFGEGYVVIITEPEQVLIDADPHELEILVRVLKSAARGYREPVSLGEEWDRPAVPFHVILAGDVEAPAITPRWRDAGAQFATAPSGD